MTFSEQFIHVMDEIFKRVGIMVDWTSQNVVPYLVDFADRFIQYQIVIDSANLLAVVAIDVALIILTRKNHKKDKYSEVTYGLGVATAVALFFSLILIPIFAQELLQSIFIPEVTIIEELMTLIN